MTRAQHAQTVVKSLEDLYVFFAYDSRYAFTVISLQQYLLAKGVRARAPTDIDPVIGNVKTELEARIIECDVVALCCFGQPSCGHFLWASWEVGLAQRACKRIVVFYETAEQKAWLQKTPFADFESVCVIDLVPLWPLPPQLPGYAQAHSELVSHGT